MLISAIKPDHAIEQDREQRARFAVRRFLQKEVALNDVAAGSAGQKLVVKHPDKKQPADARYC